MTSQINGPLGPIDYIKHLTSFFFLQTKITRKLYAFSKKITTDITSFGLLYRIFYARGSNKSKYNLKIKTKKQIIKKDQ